MKYKIVFFLILVVAISVRFIKLGSLPDGMTWDEAAIGYNAYGLITNHRDEWLKRTPIVFQSFGDFKSPLLIYLTTVPVLLFGLTSFAVRLPNAVAGVGLVIVAYLLTLEITKQRKISLFIMILTALSPWAVHYSRMGFESMIACFLTVFGVFAWLHGLTEFARNRPKWGRLYWVAGSIAMAMSLYAYHSSKIFLPILLGVLGLRYGKEFLRQRSALLIAGLIFFVVLIPLGYATVFGHANTRALSTTIVGKPNAVGLFLKNYLSHLHPSFLLQGKDITYRHSTMQVGVLYPMEVILGVSGILLIVIKKEYRHFWWIPTLFFAGLIPAGLGLDVPHSNRALLAFIWMQLASIPVFLYAQKGLRHQRVLQLFAVVVACLYSSGLIAYEKAYLSVYSSSIPLTEVGYGYEELMAYVRPQERTVDRVYFTNTYGQAYIYILFFKRLTPMEYQHGGLANYTITNDPWKEAQTKSNILVVGTDAEIPEGANIVKQIYYPDGKIAFQVAKL